MNTSLSANFKTVNDAGDRLVSAPRFQPGQVVHYRGRSRRFVVAGVENYDGRDQLHLVALSGGRSGSERCSVDPAEVVLDDDQFLSWYGSQSNYLIRRYCAARRLAGALPFPAAL